MDFLPIGRSVVINIMCPSSKVGVIFLGHHVRSFRPTTADRFRGAKSPVEQGLGGSRFGSWHFGFGAFSIWVFPKVGVFTPQNGWFIMENHNKMDDLGVPLFLETPISIVALQPFFGDVRNLLDLVQNGGSCWLALPTTEIRSISPRLKVC